MRNYRGDPLDVDLDESPSRRWEEVADRRGDQICTVVDETVAFCEEHINELTGRVQGLVRAVLHGASRLTGAVWGSIARMFGEEYPLEIKAIARQVGVSYPKLLLGNMMYDISQVMEYHGAVGCSSYSCNLPNGAPVLARTMDWAIPESLGRHTLLLRFHRGKESYLAVGVAGKVGVLSAMRPGYWAMTLNQAPCAVLRPRWLALPALQNMRAVADESIWFDDCVSNLQRAQTMTPFFAHVVGTRRSEHVVVECHGRHSEVRRRRKGAALVQTNHFQDQNLNGPVEWLDRHGQAWVSDSKPRYDALTKRLKSFPNSIDEALARLRRRPITNQQTMQSMAFCPAQWEMRLLHA